MGQFGKMVSGAKPSQGSGFWETGKYLVAVDACKAVENRHGELCFIMIGQALRSNNADCPVGCTRDWVVNMKYDSSPGNVKSFLMAATGLPENEISEDGADVVVADDNPLHGVMVGLEVTMIETRSGGEFSKHVWSKPPKLSEEETNKLRETAGLSPF